MCITNTVLGYSRVLKGISRVYQGTSRSVKEEIIDLR